MLDIVLIKSSSSCLSIAPTTGVRVLLTLFLPIHRWARGSKPVKATLLPLYVQYITPFTEPKYNLLPSQTATDCQNQEWNPESESLVSCFRGPGQGGFDPALSLDRLLCDWLDGRTCSSGTENDYRFLS